MISKIKVVFFYGFARRQGLKSRLTRTYDLERVAKKKEERSLSENSFKNCLACLNSETIINEAPLRSRNSLARRTLHSNKLKKCANRKIYWHKSIIDEE
jgi:hypothetical protein